MLALSDLSNPLGWAWSRVSHLSGGWELTSYAISTHAETACPSPALSPTGLATRSPSVLGLLLPRRGGQSQLPGVGKAGEAPFGWCMW